MLRTWGIGLPGLATGWFLLRNRAKAFCILTGRQRVTILDRGRLAVVADDLSN